MNVKLSSLKRISDTGGRTSQSYRHSSAAWISVHIWKDCHEFGLLRPLHSVQMSASGQCGWGWRVWSQEGECCWLGPNTALSFLSSRLEDKPYDWLFFNMQDRFKKKKKTVKHTLSTCIICVPVVYKYVYCNWWLIIMYIKIRPSLWLMPFLFPRQFVFSPQVKSLCSCNCSFLPAPDITYPQGQIQTHLKEEGSFNE